MLSSSCIACAALPIPPALAHIRTRKHLLVTAGLEYDARWVEYDLGTAWRCLCLSACAAELSLFWCRCQRVQGARMLYNDFLKNPDLPVFKKHSDDLSKFKVTHAFGASWVHRLAATKRQGR
jgi:hypothetical protein